MKFWQNVLEMYERLRGAGHTRLAINAAKQFNGTIVAASEKEASQFRKHFVEAVSMTTDHALLGRGEVALIVDNHVVIKLAEECQLLDDKLHSEVNRLTTEKEELGYHLNLAFEEVRHLKNKLIELTEDNLDLRVELESLKAKEPASEDK